MDHVGAGGTPSLNRFSINEHCMLMPICLQCFDAVCWAAGRASGV